jgi:hypothetical protein
MKEFDFFFMVSIIKLICPPNKKMENNINDDDDINRGTHWGLLMNI